MPIPARNARYACHVFADAVHASHRIAAVRDRVDRRPGMRRSIGRKRAEAVVGERIGDIYEGRPSEEPVLRMRVSARAAA
jgi:hypothetical protein